MTEGPAASFTGVGQPAGSAVRLPPRNRDMRSAFVLGTLFMLPIYGSQLGLSWGW